jgi:hypothetical protein
MHVAFLQFLRRCAAAGKYEVMETCATFNLAKNPDAQGVLPGAVYGIAVALNNEEARALEAEADSKGSLKTPLHRIKRLPLGQVEAIPIYWGKDAAIGYRLYRHLLDRKPKAGCLGGRFYRTLAKKDLLVAGLPVSDYAKFEQYMERQYPPMLFNIKSATIERFT